MVISLDGASFTAIAPSRVLLSLKTGELYVLHVLSTDLGRSVSGLELVKAGNSVLASSLCTLSDDLLFLGSRLGDSLLIQYVEKPQGTGQGPAPAARLPTDVTMADGEDIYGAGGLGEDPAGRPEKKPKVEPLGGGAVTTSTPFDGSAAPPAPADLDDDPFAGALGEPPALPSGDRRSKLPQYGLTVLDSLVNLGPIGDLAVGESKDAASASHGKERQVDLVTCSGAGKNGSLRVLQQGVRPEVLYQYPDLAGCQALWTLFAPTPEGELLHR